MTAQTLYRTVYGIETPYPHQQAMLEACGHQRFPLLLRAPCGTGKTEAATAPFLAQFVEGEYLLPPRLIYVLPTQALCNDIHGRLSEAAANASDDLVVSIQHGAAPQDAMLFADIAVTTLDHLIYAYARSSRQMRGHIDLPAGCIANSLVVFDEAHLYQSPYTFSLMRAMLEILNASGVPFILMTATMPESLQESFSERIDFHEVEFTGPVQDRELELQLELDRKLFDGGIASKALAAIDDAERTLIVCNTVHTAQAVYRELKSERDDVTLVHSRYTSADRTRVEKAAKNRLKEGGIVVSTQVCEAGLHVSADLLITEMAPADSLIQRSGRCARLNTDISRGTVMVFCPQNHPYEPEHIWATCASLADGPSLDLTDWTDTTEFADGMPYVADDTAARDSLFDLYEATLYADARPWDLSVREGKYLYGWAGDAEELQEKEPDEASDYLREHQITLSYITAQANAYRKKKAGQSERQGIFARKTNQYQQVRYNGNDEKWELHRIGSLSPLRTYLLADECYDAELGVVPRD